MRDLANGSPDLAYIGLDRARKVFYQLPATQLVEEALKRAEGQLADNGALVVDTGEFTGRSPKDRFIVRDTVTEETVCWGDVNIPFDADRFDALYRKVTAYMAQRAVFVRDASVCANEKFHLDVRVLTETAYQNLFVHHLFRRPETTHPGSQPAWTILAAPGFMAVPSIDGTRQHNFSIINFSRRIILIAGTGYTGEIKKGIFSVLNFLLPHERQVLPMHCSANSGPKGDTAIFFGLSGTGKTTLSADPARRLIGDDEHGWSDYSVFNFEGGCYAKCAGLTAEKEPQIYSAIRFGSLLENTRFIPGTRTVNYSDISRTENTRAAYPLSFVENAVVPSIGAVPKNIFFLTADAFGVLPPLSRLNTAQAMYYFISGYTAKVAGTETGINEPRATFSPCFGEAFLPLHPVLYARLLGKKLAQHGVNVWLLNTGWTGGAYGSGERIRLKYTRAMVSAALSGELDHANYREYMPFGLEVPVFCPGVPDSLLDPRNTWKDAGKYDKAAARLATAFSTNFEKYTFQCDPEVISAGPRQCLPV